VKIGELSKRTNTAKETIHHYIREGLLRKPRKIKGNMSNYSEGHVETLLAIKELREHYYMPLPEIKKFLIQAKKRSLSDLPSMEIKKMMDQFFKHIERFFPSKAVGRETFVAVTGVSDAELSLLEEWGIIVPDQSEGQPVYSGENVIIGRLIGEFDRLGFGEKDGTDPLDLKNFADFLRNVFFRRQQEVLRNKYGNGPLSADQLLSASVYGDLLSLVIILIFRKLDREGFDKFITSLGQVNEGRQ